MLLQLIHTVYNLHNKDYQTMLVVNWLFDTYVFLYHTDFNVDYPVFYVDLEELLSSY